MTLLSEFRGSKFDSSSGHICVAFLMFRYQYVISSEITQMNRLSPINQTQSKCWVFILQLVQFGGEGVVGRGYGENRHLVAKRLQWHCKWHSINHGTRNIHVISYRDLLCVFNQRLIITYIVHGAYGAVHITCSCKYTKDIRNVDDISVNSSKCFTFKIILRPRRSLMRMVYTKRYSGKSIPCIYFAHVWSFN